MKKELLSENDKIEPKEYLDARNETITHRDGNATESDVNLANKLLEPDSNSLDRG